jgi:CHAD domain-containing protein
MMLTTGEPAQRRSARVRRRTQPPVLVLRLSEPLSAAPSDPPVHHVRVALDTRLRALLHHDPGARTGADVEDVHQMRVSVRRMRAALKAARPLLDADWSDDLRAELGWLGRSLGPVRDLDVLLPRLRGLAADLPADQRDAADQLLGALDAEYLVARDEMLVALSAPRYTTLLERLADAVRLPLPTPTATARRPELVELVRGEYRSLRRSVRKAGPNPPDEVLHALRIKGKRLRYTGELAEPALGKPVRRVLDATAGLQEVLGDHQDACVAQHRIRELVDALEPGPDAAKFAYVAGRMTEREYARGEYQRTLWWAAWKQVKARAEEL